jgi:hypothetical protein
MSSYSAGQGEAAERPLVTHARARRKKDSFVNAFGFKVVAGPASRPELVETVGAVFGERMTWRRVDAEWFEQCDAP